MVSHINDEFCFLSLNITLGCCKFSTRNLFHLNEKNEELLRYLFRVSILKNLNIMIVKRETEAPLLINSNSI